MPSFYSRARYGPRVLHPSFLHPRTQAAPSRCLRDIPPGSTGTLSLEVGTPRVLVCVQAPTQTVR